mmetsp:Transcript_42665/g.100270  ORF Transcript_42665/g.100270 Transcript_42665/m.100270 type:complete len:329 (+) Transcript_42665:175-1161(+)
MIERRALLGSRRVSGRASPVVGDLAPFRANHSSIAVRSYENPSDAIHGSDITACVKGHTSSTGTSSIDCPTSSCVRALAASPRPDFWVDASASGNPILLLSKVVRSTSGSLPPCTITPRVPPPKNAKPSRRSTSSSSCLLDLTVMNSSCSFTSHEPSVTPSGSDSSLRDTDWPSSASMSVVPVWNAKRSYRVPSAQQRRTTESEPPAKSTPMPKSGSSMLVLNCRCRSSAYLPPLPASITTSHWSPIVPERDAVSGLGGADTVATAIRSISALLAFPSCEGLMLERVNEGMGERVGVESPRNFCEISLMLCTRSSTHATLDRAYFESS